MKESRTAETSQTPADAPKPPPGPWVLRGEAMALLALTTVFLIGVTIALVQQWRTGRAIRLVPAEGAEPVFQVDVNSATKDELMLLPHVGERRAEQIVAWRATHGPFQRVEDVAHAAGLTQAQLNELRDHLSLKPLE